MSCAMVCGDSNIWPMPTGKTSLSTRSVTLRAVDIAIHVETKFTEVERMFRLAFDIFLTDLRDLEASLGAVVNGKQGSSEREEKSNKESGQNPDVSETEKHCDIKNLDVKVMIDGSPNVYVSLDMDESYNMTVLSKYTHYIGIWIVLMGARVFRRKWCISCPNTCENIFRRTSRVSLIAAVNLVR